MSEPHLDTPRTPLHPNPDSEVNLKDIASEAPQDFDLDLNPDMSDDAEDVENPTDDQDIVLEDVNIPTDNKAFTRLKQEERDTLNMQQSPSITSLKELNSLTEFATREEFDDGGFDDIEEPRNTPLNPFTSIYNSELANNPRRKSVTNNNATDARRLSSAQQSRFVQYIDDQLLQIQRRFIKYISSTEENPAVLELKDQYSLSKLLADLSSVLDFIWYSIFETKSIPLISSKRMSSLQDEPPILHRTRIFGQTSYLIKIMGDFVDYVQKFKIEESYDLIDVLAFLKKIDSFVSILIDQTESSDISIVDNTERVRMDAIISRSKLIMMDKFEQMKARLTSANSEEKTSESIVREYEEKIGEIYEGIIERISI